MLSHFLNPPNWFTSASLFCSVYALTLLLSHPEPSGATLVTACILVIFGGIFDMLDGRVARLTRSGSAFGVQLDSIADMLGFGLAPAMIAWSWRLHELGFVGVLVTFWYVLAAAFRLARFNVNAAGPSSWPFAGHSQGLTSTMSGGILVTLVWLSEGWLEGRVQVPPALFAGLVGLLGYLMVSSIPFRNFRDLRNNRRAMRILSLALAACLVSAVVVDLSLFWGVGAALYLVGGLADGLVTAVHHRRLGRALGVSVDEDEDDEEVEVL